MFCCLIYTTVFFTKWVLLRAYRAETKPQKSTVPFTTNCRATTWQGLNTKPTRTPLRKHTRTTRPSTCTEDISELPKRTCPPLLSTSKSRLPPNRMHRIGITPRNRLKTYMWRYLGCTGTFQSNGNPLHATTCANEYTLKLNCTYKLQCFCIGKCP